MNTTQKGSAKLYQIKIHSFITKVIKTKGLLGGNKKAIQIFRTNPKNNLVKDWSNEKQTKKH